MGYLTLKSGKMEWISDNSYPVLARFQSVSGLETGASVEMAGVRIGKVEAITLDQKSKIAFVKIKIKKSISLSEDVIASISTAGLIGEKFIKLSPGASKRILKAGDVITETESAVSLEELIRKVVFGGVEK